MLRRTFLSLFALLFTKPDTQPRAWLITASDDYTTTQYVTLSPTKPQIPNDEFYTYQSHEIPTIHQHGLQLLLIS